MITYTRTELPEGEELCYTTDEDIQYPTDLTFTTRRKGAGQSASCRIRKNDGEKGSTAGSLTKKARDERVSVLRDANKRQPTKGSAAH